MSRNTTLLLVSLSLGKDQMTPSCSTTNSRWLPSSGYAMATGRLNARFLNATSVANFGKGGAASADKGPANKTKASPASRDARGAYGSMPILSGEMMKANAEGDFPLK